MDFSRDFSLYDRRRLAEIEAELSTDRRLVDLMAVLGSKRAKVWRRARCAGVRIRRPRTVLRSASPLLKLGVVLSLLLTVAVPVVLVTALALSLAPLAVVAVCVLPLPPVLLALLYHRVTHVSPG